MYPRANQFPQFISLTTKKCSAQGSMVPPHGRAVAKGLQPRNTARHMVTNKLGRVVFFLVFSPYFSTCDTSSVASRILADLRLAQVEKNENKILPGLVVTMWCAAAQDQSPFAAARPWGGTIDPWALRFLVVTTKKLLVRRLIVGISQPEDTCQPTSFVICFTHQVGDLIGSTINQVILWSSGPGQVLGS